MMPVSGARRVHFAAGGVDIGAVSGRNWRNVYGQSTRSCHNWGVGTGGPDSVSISKSCSRSCSDSSENWTRSLAVEPRMRWIDDACRHIRTRLATYSMRAMPFGEPVASIFTVGARTAMSFVFNPTILLALSSSFEQALDSKQGATSGSRSTESTAPVSSRWRA